MDKRPIIYYFYYFFIFIFALLADFSAFKDRVTKRFRDLSAELSGKPNEHALLLVFAIPCFGRTVMLK
ncbi:hypothetical protein Daudx_2021 [Candidatus Desulforudis audaxviator]|nr:hypothetical protein Daudx_2021 [Candidatus Desulforudis audaxviator]